MQSNIIGLHHVTAMSGHPQRNVDFYHGVLGLRLVKVSVNQDDPDTYHLFYGDGKGSPGSAMTFFPWMNMRAGYVGARQVGVTAFSVPKTGIPYWQLRLEEAGFHPSLEERFGEPTLMFADPDGILLEIVGTPDDPRPAWADSPVPQEFGIHGFHHVELWTKDPAPTGDFLTQVFRTSVASHEGDRTRHFFGTGAPGQIVDIVHLPERPNGLMGVGTVHHVAFRTPTPENELIVREAVEANGLRPTEVIDRFWFKSVYFREPGGVLFELATDAPGFDVDEHAEKLGEKLILPPWLEARRSLLEKSLVHFELPNGVSFPI
ncbi:MAG: ring-cleaving dioxygenase [Fimbriimonadaceae bacterium]|nr:ring-cleaving dioxygenase [Fimbriimonadaceae bacterium]